MKESPRQDDMRGRASLVTASDNEILATYRRHHHETASILAKVEPLWLTQRRKQAMESFLCRGLPGPRDESWRQSDLRDLRSAAFIPHSPHLERTTNDPDGSSPFKAGWAQNGHARLNFLDGVFHSALGFHAESDDGVWAGSLADALRLYPQRMEAYLGKIAHADPDAFLALNTAFFADAAVVLIEKNARVDRPLHVTFHTTGSTHRSLDTARLLVVADAGSAFSLLETHTGEGRELGMSLAAAEFHLGESSHVDHLRIQDEAQDQVHLGTIHAHLETGAEYRGTAVSLGATFHRLETHADLAGPGANVSLGGLYLADGSRFVDHLTTVDHGEPEGKSEQVYQGILKDSSRAVFTGRIRVRQDAQKTDAVQSNANLLLSPDASVHSRPQLEILADDVKCTHGATIGALDDDALFYARTRGIPFDIARMMLVRAFASRLLERPEMALAGESLEERIGDFLSPKDRVKEGK